MCKNHSFSQIAAILGLVGILAGCGEPRAVMLPLQYPDGSPVTTTRGEPVMAGYQTFGTAMHSNATALYETARPTTCVTCAKIGAVVSEPSVLRQITGFVGTSSQGAGAVMTGIGVMDYGGAAGAGKLGTDVTQNSSVAQQSSRRGNYPGEDRGFSKDHDHDFDHDHDHDHYGDNSHDHEHDHYGDNNHDHDHDHYGDNNHDHDRDHYGDNNRDHERDGYSASSWSTASDTSRTGQGERVPSNNGY